MANPAVSRKLNIVLAPFETKDGPAYVHSTPIGRSVFEASFRPMARAMSSIVSDGIGPISGPSVAALLLQQEADAIGEGNAVRNGLMPELKRLTNVGLPNKNENIPYVVATQRGIIDEDRASEVENILCYFTLASWIRLPEGLSSGLGLDGLRTLWSAQITSSDLTAFMHSLKTSTTDANTGAKTPAPTTATNPSSIAA